MSKTRKDPPAALDVFSVRMHIPWIGQKKKITPCTVGHANSTYEAALWLRSLSQRYTARVEDCLDPRRCKMIISAACNTPAGARDFDMFEISFQKDCKSCCIRMPNPSVKVPVLVDEYCQMGPPPEAKGWRLHFIPSNAFSLEDTESRHPYDVMRRLIRGCAVMGECHTDEAQIVLGLLDPMLAGDFNKRILNARARSELASVLSDWSGGSVRIKYTLATGTTLEKCGDRWLFSLTCVFPWCVDILVKRPNCLSTDSTFKSLDPYTLPILHAIVANESIPIAFGVSPTETWESYDMIYRHITSLHTTLAQCLRRSNTGQNPLESPDSLHSRSHGDWPEDPPTTVEDEIAGELPEEVESFDVEVVNTSPMVETENNFPADMRGILCSLPLLTDQGSALAKFIGIWKLTWKICHRHIIESMDAHSLIGQWGARLLRCYSEDEWQRTCAVIREEMVLMISQWSTTTKGYPSLIRLLGDGPDRDRDKHHLADIDHWALWRRLGCPRTTNSAESVNGHLNAKIKPGQDFFERLRIVVEHFKTRYFSRNTWCDRALKRNAGKCFPSDQTKEMPWFSPERRDFYVALHNAYGLEKPVKRQFQPEDIRCMIMPDFSQQTTQSCELPQTFQASNTDSLASKESKRIVLRPGNCHTASSYLALQITYSLRGRLGKQTWSEYATDIFEKVVVVMGELKIEEPASGPICASDEARWRSECWLNAGTWIATFGVPTSPPVEIRPTTNSSIPTGAFWPLFTANAVTKGRRQQPPPPTSCRTPDGRLLRGLPNVGRTCFFNAALQCLFHVPALRLYFSKHAAHLRAKGQWEFTKSRVGAYLKLEKAVESGNNNDKTLKDARRGLAGFFLVDREHDLAEFLDSFFTNLHNELNGCRRAALGTEPPGGPQDEKGYLGDREWAQFLKCNESIIRDLFCSQSVKLVHCPSCGILPVKFATHHIVRLPLPAEQDRSLTGVSLEACLRAYSEPQFVSTHGCPDCKLVGVHTSDQLTRLPPVLVLQLGRFNNSVSSDFKDEAHVSFPDTLDMTPYISGDHSGRQFMYELRSVAEHVGVRGTNGHYKAFLRFFNSWYCCDDAHVAESDSDTVHGVQAYVLFYERVFVDGA